MPTNLFKPGKDAPGYIDGRCSKIHECIICGNPISHSVRFGTYNSGRCKYCSSQIRAFNQSFIKGKIHWNWQGGIPNCVDCNKKLSSRRATRCYSCAIKNQYKLGRMSKTIKKVNYSTFSFRSGWEANFAKWLDLSGIEWKYESKTFNLGSTTYTPDFYLPEFDCYIEIKGRWLRDAKKKFSFVQKYWDENLFAFEQPKLKELGII